MGLLGIGFSLIETQMRDAGSGAGADSLRRILSFGSWTDTGGAIRYRIAELLSSTHTGVIANVIGVLAFVALAASLYHFARKPLEIEGKG